jgi:hypothetical protein
MPNRITFGGNELEEIVAMVDDKPEDDEHPESRAKRAPPTIDLEASEVSGQTQSAGAGSHARRSFAWPSRPAISTAVIAAIFGAAAAAVVIAMSALVGEPKEAAAPQVSPDAIEALASRVANIEARADKSPASTSNPAVATRIETLEKSLAALRGELAAARAQSEKLATDVDEVKSAPRETSPGPDLSAINERLAGIERLTRAQSAETAQENTKPADDLALRRVVAASLLDVSVRQGDSYAAVLAAAKSLAADPDALKPLDGFAASGVPHAAALGRELLTLMPKLSSPAPENATAGSGIIDRLQAGASRLVRIERTDTSGHDRSAVVARATAAALRNDIAEARHELNTLAPADRAAVQAWLDKADARDAALAASRQFATEAMAAFGRS